MEELWSLTDKVTRHFSAASCDENVVDQLQLSICVILFQYVFYRFGYSGLMRADIQSK